MKKEKGITLIALIITIIVMLILVAVTINVALEGGLFTKAKDAAVKTDKHGIYETIVSGAVFTNDGDIDVETTKTNAITTLTAEDGNTVTDKGRGILQVDSKSGTYYYQITTTEIKILDKLPDASDYIGDYVNYDPLLMDDDTYFDRIYCSIETNSIQNIAADSKQNWKIFGIDNNGRILITTEDAIPSSTYNNQSYNSLRLSGKFGNFNSRISANLILNCYSGIYGLGKYADKTAYTYVFDTAKTGSSMTYYSTYKDGTTNKYTTMNTGGRSINVEDVNEINGYTPETYESHTYSYDSENYICVDNVRGTGNYQYYGVYDETENTVLNYTSLPTATVYYTNYTYSLGNSTKAQQLLRSNSSYFLASWACDGDATGLLKYYQRIVENNTVTSAYMLSSRNDTSAKWSYIRPIVTLASNVELTEQDENGVWQLGYK